MKINMLLGLSFSFICFAASAMTEVSTVGVTVPFSDYCSLIAKDKTQAVPLKTGEPIKTDAIMKSRNGGFQLGLTKKRKLNLKHPLPMPIYIIGNDKESISWAMGNREYLKKIRAFGVVVNVRSQKELAALEKKLGLNLVPANLEGLSSLIGVSRYPVLIKDGWAAQ